MKQHQADRLVFEEPESDPGWFALYVWAVIAALSALVACITFLIPTIDEPFKVVERHEAETNRQQTLAAGADAAQINEKSILKPVAEEPTAQQARRKMQRLLNKYLPTEEPSPDPITTATVSQEVEQDSTEVIEPGSTYADAKTIGATIGVSDSVPALAQRYAALQRRAPELFETIDPLVELVEGNDRLEARLVAGPFFEIEDLSQFCRAIRLRMTIDCTAGEYAGEPLLQ